MEAVRFDGPELESAEDCKLLIEELKLNLLFSRATYCFMDIKLDMDSSSVKFNAGSFDFVVPDDEGIWLGMVLLFYLQVMRQCNFLNHRSIQQVIEMAETDPSENETKSSILSDVSNNGIVEKSTDTKELLKWDRMAIILAFTALMSLLSVSYFSTSNDKLFPKTFKSQWSYAMFLMVINAAFYFPIVGFMLRQKHPKIGKAFSVIAFLALIVSFTLLSSKLLPTLLNWVPWVLGIFTVGALIFQVLPDFPWN